MREHPLSWPLRWYRAALAWSSREFRLRFRDEAVESLGLALASERERRGRRAAASLWVRAMLDAIASTVRSRKDDGGWFGGAAADVVLAGRSIRRSPQYAAVMIGTLALAIGGVAAVFMLADPMLFRALPYRDADRLVRVSAPNATGVSGYMHVPDFDRLESAGVFERVATFDGPIVARATDLADTEPMLGYGVTDGFFDTLGIGVARGRPFVADDFRLAKTERAPLNEWQGAPVIITDALWTALGQPADFAARPLRLTSGGTTVSLPVIGVLRPDFVLPDAGNRAPRFLLPGTIDRTDQTNPRMLVDIFARLRPGVSRAATISQVQAIAEGVSADFPTLRTVRTVRLTGLRELLFARVRVPLLMLLAVTVLVLLLAVGNLTHLSLARAAQRSREVALRRALGGSRWRIVRLLLVEAAVLAVIGGAGALAFGDVLFQSVMAVMPRLAHVYRLLPSGMSSRVVAVVAASGMLSVMAVGLIPAVTAGRQSLSAVLQSAGGRARGRRRAGDRVLVAMQAALAASILVATALLVGSFVKLANSVSGIDQSGLVTAAIEWPRGYAARPADRLARTLELVDAAKRESGVEIGVQSGIPGLTLPTGLWAAGAAPTAKAVATAFPWDRAALEIFRLELVEGRLMTDEEGRTNAPVAVIDERAASFLSPGMSAIGRVVADGQVRGVRTERRVIGVVKTLELSFGRPATDGFAFVPPDPRGSSVPSLVWRGQMDERLVKVLRDALARSEPAATISVSEFRPFERRFGEPRLLARITGFLGVLALVLTIGGVYAVTSHAVSGRTSEIGVRMALGATGAAIKGLILRETVAPALIGVAIGLGGAALWAKTIESLLFSLTSREPLVYAASAGLIIAVVTVAALIPASRAGRINPTEALRAD